MAANTNEMLRRAGGASMVAVGYLMGEASTYRDPNMTTALWNGPVEVGVDIVTLHPKDAGTHFFAGLDSVQKEIEHGNTQPLVEFGIAAMKGAGIILMAWGVKRMWK